MILVFPDLHLARNTDEIEATIARLCPDETVFLGDYFDQFDSRVIDYTKMAAWLLNSLAKPNRVHVLGNHDMPYMDRNLRNVTGTNALARVEVSRIMTLPAWKKTCFAHASGPWLFTHAGLTYQTWLKRCHRSSDPAVIADTINEVSRRVFKRMRAWKSDRDFNGRLITDWTMVVGKSRGGDGTKPPGPFWCGLDEFCPVPGVCQVFGHTHTTGLVKRLGRDSLNLCLDTSTAFACHHALILERAQDRTRVIDIHTGLDVDPVLDTVTV